ncbi:eEF1A lysine and N-terminal methyltransferase [Linum grandiflorum]
MLRRILARFHIIVEFLLCQRLELMNGSFLQKKDNGWLLKAQKQVILDSSHSSASMGDIQSDLSPLVSQLAPAVGDNAGRQIPFMMAGDPIKQRNNVHQVTSPLTGPVIVEDVVYENVDRDAGILSPSGDLVFRRLVFQRTENLVQSEALLITNGAQKGDRDQRRISNLSSKSKKKQDLKEKDESSSVLQVYHDYLASSYHLGIISGFVLITSYLENMAAAGKKVNAVVIGLGAGLLPLFLHRSIPFLHCEVVELDPVILNIASDYFGFVEDEDLKVHIADGIKYIEELKVATVGSSVAMAVDNGSTNSSNKNMPNSDAGDKDGPRIDILVIDVDSADSSSGISCPAADFVEESFLLTAKKALSKEGLFVVNLVARSSTMKEIVISRMKTVFNHLYSLQLEEDVNMILFGLSCEESIAEESFPKSVLRLQKLLKLTQMEMSQNIVNGTKNIRCLK